jgi:hypothetical protein
MFRYACRYSYPEANLRPQGRTPTHGKTLKTDLRTDLKKFYVSKRKLGEAKREFCKIARVATQRIARMALNHTHGIESHTWQRIARMASNRTRGNASHAWHRIARMATHRTLGNALHAWQRSAASGNVGCC